MNDDELYYITSEDVEEFANIINRLQADSIDRDSTQWQAASNIEDIVGYMIEALGI